MKEKILIVDDNAFNRDLLMEILKEEYDILEAENGRDALDIIKMERTNVAAVLLDLVMPIMDGYEFMKAAKEMGITDKVPVLVISGETDVQNENKCFDYGVSDFIGRPFNAIIVKKRVQNAVNHFAYKNRLEDKVQEQTEVLRKAYRQLKAQTEQLEKQNQEIIDMLGTVVEFRNLESGEHIQRVKKYTEILGRQFAKQYPEYGLTDEKIETIVAASALHDIGKIAIPDSILLKPGKLTKDEFDYMKSHTIRGCELLDSMHVQWDKNTRQASYEIIRHHHERYDGKGYPDGLKGEDIPISAQLVSLADVYDALVNERCYKEAFSKEKAFSMIINGECGIFSPRLMETFRTVREAFENCAGDMEEEE